MILVWFPIPFCSLTPQLHAEVVCRLNTIQNHFVVDGNANASMMGYLTTIHNPLRLFGVFWPVGGLDASTKQLLIVAIAAVHCTGSSTKRGIDAACPGQAGLVEVVQDASTAGEEPGKVLQFVVLKDVQTILYGKRIIQHHPIRVSTWGSILPVRRVEPIGRLETQRQSLRWIADGDPLQLAGGRTLAMLQKSACTEGA